MKVSSSLGTIDAFVARGDDADELVDELRVAADGDPDALVISLTRTDPLHLGILRGFGKDTDVRGGDRDAMADAWLTGSSIRTLIVVGAEHLTEDRLRHLATGYWHPRPTLILAHFGDQPGGRTRGSNLWDIAREMGWPVLGHDDAIARCAAAAGTRNSPEEVADEARGPVAGPPLPSTDLPLFLHDCRAAGLTTFRRAEEQFTRARLASERAASRGGDLEDPFWLSEHLRSLVPPAAPFNDELASLRGAQAGFWAGGWWMRMRYRDLRSEFLRRFGSDDDEALADTLSAIRRCTRPNDALAALCVVMAGLGPNDLHDLDVSHLAEDGTLHLPRRTIDLEDRTIVRAALTEHQLLGQGPLKADWPLIATAGHDRPRASEIRRTLDNCAADLNIELTARKMPSLDDEPRRWLSSRGISIRKFES